MATTKPTSNVKIVKEPGAPADTGQTEEQALEAQVSDTSGVDLPKEPAPAVDLTDPAQLQAYIDMQI
jgi:hypothetical protein